MPTIVNPYLIWLVVLLCGAIGGIVRLLIDDTDVSYPVRRYVGAAVIGIAGALLAWWGCDYGKVSQPGQFAAALTAAIVSDFVIARLRRRAQITATPPGGDK